MATNAIYMSHKEILYLGSSRISSLSRAYTAYAGKDEMKGRRTLLMKQMSFMVHCEFGREGVTKKVLCVRS